MPAKLKDFTHKIKKIFADRKKTTILLIIGILGIVLIGFSEISSDGKNTKNSTESDTITVDEYIRSLENKTVKIISSVDGAGKSKIMITAEASKEQIFAINQDKSQDSDQNSEITTEIVLIEGENGDEALVTREIEPKIRGVLVLCEGADDPLVNEKITQAIKTVLGVASNKICVLKLK